MEKKPIAAISTIIVGDEVVSHNSFHTFPHVISHNTRVCGPARRCAEWAQRLPSIRRHARISSSVGAAYLQNPYGMRSGLPAASKPRTVICGATRRKQSY